MCLHWQLNIVVEFASVYFICGTLSWGKVWSCINQYKSVSFSREWQVLEAADPDPWYLAPLLVTVIWTKTLILDTALMPSLPRNCHLGVKTLSRMQNGSFWKLNGLTVVLILTLPLQVYFTKTTFFKDCFIIYNNNNKTICTGEHCKHNLLQICRL